MTAYVATFFSFKGGVGRTTLLVNVAHVLAARGERVLVWDLDVEAPGAHQFPGLESPDQIWENGFVEWLGSLPAVPDDPPVEWPGESALRTLGDRVYRARVQTGEILVLPAYGSAAEIGDAYGRVDWHALFVEGPARGLAAMRRALDALVARFDPAFVFIDSRTGVSDLGGVVTGYLPDCTVLVGNYSRQSTEGLRKLYLALEYFRTDAGLAESGRATKLERLLVASPVPNAAAARDQGRARWANGFSGVAPRSLVEVPLVESLLYAEDVLVRTAPHSDAATAYTRVADQLATLRIARTREGGFESAAEAKGIARVAEVLTLLGFEVERRDDDLPDRLVALEKTTLGSRKYFVVYVAGTARVNTALRDALDALVSNAVSGQGTMIVTDAARDDARQAAGARDVVLLTISELEERLFDRLAYARHVVHTFEGNELARTYVELALVIGDGTQVESIDYLAAWARGSGPRLCVLAGPRGSGKTSLLERFVYELAARFEGERALPLVLKVSAFAGVSLASSIQVALAGVGWFGNPSAILYLVREGRLVLAIDDVADAEQLAALIAFANESGGSAAGNRVLATTRDEDLREASMAVAIAPLDRARSEQLITNLSPPAGTRAWLSRLAQTAAFHTLEPSPQLLRAMADWIERDHAKDPGAISTSEYEAFLEHAGQYGGSPLKLPPGS